MATMMPAGSEPSANSQFDLERAELARVLASGIFGRAPSLAQFLSYICESYFDGQENRIKEYNIAVEALGRPENFDQKQDSIVRVEAHRLRKRLKQYYETEGLDHPLHIVVASGKYVPRFVKPEVRSEVEVITAATPYTEAVLELTLRPQPVLLNTPRPGAVRWRMRAIGIVLAALILAIGIYGLQRRSLLWRTSPADEPLRVNGIAAGGAGDEIRILAGSHVSSYVDHLGNIWNGDRYFRSGDQVRLPDRPVRLTQDPAIFQTCRAGKFFYDIPLKGGTWELHLYFAETAFGEGTPTGGGEASRLFQITANGKTLAESFDVVSDAGSSFTADEKIYKDISPGPDGFLHLGFSGWPTAFVNALEVLPGVPGEIRPIRIAAARNRMAYTGAGGEVWNGDHFFSGGQTVIRTDPVKSTQDPELYRGERFGNFAYAIPVPKGRYKVTLYFTETWFGPERFARGGIGSRLFNVYCNGATLLKDFDITKEAGGGYRAATRTFRGLEPNAQDKLVLSFVPVRNYACINAIEVLAEK